VEIRGIFDESWEILDQAAGDSTQHNRAMRNLYKFVVMIAGDLHSNRYLIIELLVAEAI
jgi:hypothetical protein